MERESDQLQLAVLIDADNAPASVIEGILEESARLGSECEADASLLGGRLSSGPA